MSLKCNRLDSSTESMFGINQVQYCRKNLHTNCEEMLRFGVALVRQNLATTNYIMYQRKLKDNVKAALKIIEAKGEVNLMQM